MRRARGVRRRDERGDTSLGNDGGATFLSNTRNGRKRWKPLMMATASSVGVFPLNISVDMTRRAEVGANAVDIDEVVLVLAVPYQRPFHEFGNQCRRNQQSNSTATWLSLTMTIPRCFGS